MKRKMKDSGIDWIGEIPEEWKIVRNKYLFVLNKQVVEDSFADYQLLSLTTKGIKEKDIDNPNGKLPESFSTYQVVNRNDLILCLFDIDVSAVFSGISNYEGMITSAYKVVKCTEKIIPMFASYWFRFAGFDRIYKMYSKSLRYTINSDDFGFISTAVPPKHQQQKIATFLDQKCSEIDHILEKTRESIEEYKKLKQSIITEAVTKGLNRNVEMKDSGVEWIGEIPKHWEVAKVKNFYEVVLGKMLCNNKVNDDYTLENYLCSQNIKWNSISQDEIKKMWFSSKEKEQYLLKNGDVVITEGGSVGVSSIYKDEAEPCYIQNAVHRARGKNGNKNIMLYYWMTLIITGGYMDLICNKATIAHYTKEKLENTPFLSIPILEQQQISDYLDKKCSEIDSLISQKETLLTDLEAYKKSLIFECVTGKREVM